MATGLGDVAAAQANGLGGIVLADSLFGTVTEFRQQLAAEGRTYCVGVDSTLKVIEADADLGPVPKYSGRGQPPTRPLKVRAGTSRPASSSGPSNMLTTFAV